MLSPNINNQAFSDPFGAKYTYTHTKTHTHTHTHTHTQTHTHTHARTHKHMQAHTHARTQTHTQARSNTHTHTHTHKICDSVSRHIFLEKKYLTRAEEFGQNYVRSAATSVDKSENSPQFFLHNFALKALNLKTKIQRIQRKIM